MEAECLCDVPWEEWKEGKVTDATRWGRPTSPVSPGSAIIPPTPSLKMSQQGLPAGNLQTHGGLPFLKSASPNLYFLICRI